MKTKNILVELMLFLCLYAHVSCDRTNKKHRENGWYHVVDNEKNSLSLKPIVTVKDFINLRMDSDCLGNSVIIGQISKYKLDKWVDETEKAIGKQIAFVFNDTIISNPQVNQRLESGTFQISVPQGSNIDLSSIYHQLRKEKLDEQIYTFYYRGLDKYNGDTLHLWRTTADGLKSDKDYGKQPIASKVITNGEVTFSGIADTLHLYYVDGRNCNAHFYPENGEIIYAYMKGSQYNNPQSIANQYKELESNGFLKEASGKFLYTNLQNAMGIYLLDRIGFYPDELEYIYQNCHPMMKDTVSILLSMKRQLEQTSKLEKGARYIDFKQKGFEQDSIHLSDCFRQRKEICLFFVNDDKKDFIRHIEQLQKKYKDILFIGCTITHLMDREYIKLLKETYKVLLFDDRKSYEKSVMYQYRVDYRKRMNYCLLFDKDGYLKEIYID